MQSLSLDGGSPSYGSKNVDFLKKKSSLGSTLHTHQETERICVIKYFNRQNNVTNFCGHMMVRSRGDPGTSQSAAQCPVKTDRKWPESSTAGFQQEVLLLLLSSFSHVQLCMTPQTAAHQAPPSLGFSRQQYWSGLSIPSPMHARMLSRFSHVRPCTTPRTATHQVPPSTEFSRQEYWSGLPFPSLSRR